MPIDVELILVSQHVVSVYLISAQCIIAIKYPSTGSSLTGPSLTGTFCMLKETRHYMELTRVFLTSLKFGDIGLVCVFCRAGMLDIKNVNGCAFHSLFIGELGEPFLLPFLIVLGE